MDKMGEKRKRSSNFQLSETRLLVDTVLPFKDIIENKANDSFNIQEKNHAWEKIAAIFNAVGCGEVHRNPKVLKLKYEGIKKLLRRKLAEHKREMYVSGRESMSPIKMEDYEEKMFSNILCNTEDTNTRYENNDLKMDRNGHMERTISERYDLSNTSTFDGEDAEMVELNGQMCSPDIQEITIKHEIESPNIEMVTVNENCNVTNETATSDPPLSRTENLEDFEPRTTLNENPRSLKWKQFNTRKMKVKKASFQHSRTEGINKLKYQDNEIIKQELEIEFLKAEHELRKKILEKELEEKEAVLKRNDDEHRLKMRLMEIQLKHKELELLSKMNT